VDVGEGQVHVDRHALAKLLTPRYVYAAQARSTYFLPLRAPRGSGCEDPTFVSGFASTSLSSKTFNLQKTQRRRGGEDLVDVVCDKSALDHKHDFLGCVEIERAQRRTVNGELIPVGKDGSRCQLGGRDGSVWVGRTACGGVIDRILGDRTATDHAFRLCPRGESLIERAGL